MTIPVWWLSYHEPDGIIRRGYWDQGVVERLLDGRLWRVPGGHTFETVDDPGGLLDYGGGIVVVPARHHVHDIDRLNADLALVDWCVLILTGDEEQSLPHQQLTHESCAVWLMTPGDDPDCDHFIGTGYHPDTPDVLALASEQALARPLDWAFAGQVTHDARRDCLAALLTMTDRPHQLLSTEGFTQGLPRHQYLAMLASAKIAPCPSGPATPDTMRLWEALEAGCLPVVQSNSYWMNVAPGLNELLPMVDGWDDLPARMPELLADWPNNANRASAWWQGEKRRLAQTIEQDVRDLYGTTSSEPMPGDRITVVIPTSPIPSHPDTDIIAATIDSVRAELPLAEIHVWIDGVRPEQADRADDYAEFVRRLLWQTNHRWDNVLPLLADEFAHQSGLLSQFLPEVTTPHVLFVEHDTPLTRPRDDTPLVPWAQLCDAIDTGSANVVRLSHEGVIPPEHHHLMLDTEPQDICGAPLIRTVQWSQRPHLASVAYYRRLSEQYFPPDARTMIEDVMHGVVDFAHREHDIDGWHDHKVWLYAPPGDMRRSAHLDGRGDDPKYDMTYSYSGTTPPGAPRATSERVD